MRDEMRKALLEHPSCTQKELEQRILQKYYFANQSRTISLGLQNDDVMMLNNTYRQVWCRVKFTASLWAFASNQFGILSVNEIYSNWGSAMC